MAFGADGVGLGGKKLTMSQLSSLMAAAAKSVDPEVDRSLRRASQVGVGLMKKAIQGLHAVDTGTMLNSTTAESIDKTTVLIGPTVNYAVFVAEGTSRMAARPFHRIAAAELISQLPELGFDPKNLGV